MKVSEVLKRYAAGDRDFRRVNLRGQSFKGADLSGADFSHADIEGTNFQGAILRGTKFCGAKAGLQKHWTLILRLVSWIISGIAGFILAFTGVLVSSIFDNSSLQNQVIGWVFLGVLIVIFAVFIRQGIGRVGPVGGVGGVGRVGRVGGVGRVAEVFAGTLLYGFLFAVSVAVILGEDFTSYLPFFLVFFFVFFSAFPFSTAVTIAVTFAVPFAVPFSAAFSPAFAFTFAFAVDGAFAFAFAFAVFVLAFATGGAVAFAFAFAGLLVSTYLGWRAMKGDPRDVWVRTIAVAFAATGGTTFKDADLTDADFSGATLDSTDLRAKSLIRTCFKDTIKLIQARAGKTLLADSNVRELLVTGSGL
ncbi:pentapeptide repeat-containing protein [Gloeothece verrucosa]|uniref:pentapeptide repeat-containing protein n=1 Tax=Gloeothece verrucosa TaxID=2546359 RepID=UPI0002FB9883|nr:pentapeptide repeat-containing protein [Gloeothece verrucosa]